MNQQIEIRLRIKFNMKMKKSLIKSIILNKRTIEKHLKANFKKMVSVNLKIKKVFRRQCKAKNTDL